MIEIPEDVVTGTNFARSSQTTYINEKTISGLTPIKQEKYWEVPCWNSSVSRYDYKKLITPRYVFKVYFDGNAESYSYFSEETAQSWHNLIKDYLSQN